MSVRYNTTKAVRIAQAIFIRTAFLYLLRIEKMNFIICYLFDTADCNGLNDHSLEIKNNAIVGIIAITDAAMIKA